METLPEAPYDAPTHAETLKLADKTEAFLLTTIVARRSAYFGDTSHRSRFDFQLDSLSVHLTATTRSCCGDTSPSHSR